MSLFVTATATCGGCGAAAEVSLCASVNADRRDDLRKAILDGSFQAEACASCGERLRLPAHLSYLDIGRGQWILVEGAGELPGWQAAEHAARALFDRSYGDAAPAQSRELGGGLRPRLVFGWAALREKLLCDDLGLADVTLELLKIAVIRNVREPPFGDTTELRLTGGDAASLSFAWVEAATEAILTTLDIGRDLYDDIAADPTAWATLRGELEGRLFVDLKRMVFITPQAGTTGSDSPLP